MPDHPNSFMKMINKGIANAMSTVNDEKRQVLNPLIIWDGSIDRFDVFRNNVEGHYGQISSGYLFDTEFQISYFERGTDCYTDFLDEVPSSSQIKKDAHALYGGLLSACQASVGRRIFTKNRNKQDVNQASYQSVNRYETYGNRNFRIKNLENAITTVFHQKYKGGLIK
jgi:hypothetical protein